MNDDFIEDSSVDSFGSLGESYRDDTNYIYELFHDEGLEGVEESEELDDGVFSDSDSNIYMLRSDIRELQASIEDGNYQYNLDSDLNDLPLSDVLLLILALVLGVICVRSRG